MEHAKSCFMWRKYLTKRKKGYIMEIETGIYDLSCEAPHHWMLGIYSDTHLYGGRMYAVCFFKWYIGVIIK